MKWFNWRSALKTICGRFLQFMFFCLHRETNFSAVAFEVKNPIEVPWFWEPFDIEMVILQRPNTAPFSKTSLTTQAHTFHSASTHHIPHTNLFLCLLWFPKKSGYFFFKNVIEQSHRSLPSYCHFTTVNYSSLNTLSHKFWVIWHLLLLILRMYPKQ